MEHDEVVGLRRQVSLGEEYANKAKAITDDWIASALGISKRAVKLCKGQDGKSHRLYPLVAPYLSARDRYKSKAHVYSRKMIAKANGMTVAELSSIVD